MKPCLFCKTDFEPSSKTIRRQKFCSTKCRVYHARSKKKKKPRGRPKKSEEEKLKTKLRRYRRTNKKKKEERKQKRIIRQREKAALARKVKKEKNVLKVKAKATKSVKKEITPRQKHWEPGDPKEGSLAFFRKYNAWSYEEIE